MDLEPIEQGPKDSLPSGLFAGTARADITPPVGIAQMNWGSQTHIESVGIDPTGMKVTALVLSDGRQRFAMVDIDRLFVEGIESAIDIASKRTGIPAAHIRLGASHTHASVLVSPEKVPRGIDLSSHVAMAERYRLQIIDKVASVIAEANERLEPAHIGGGRGKGTININRRVRANGSNPPAVGRNPKGFVDRELIVFRIDNALGKPLAVVANFQCHGTVLAYENKFISPDWPGMTRQTVESAMPGALCLFFQGAAGNQGPVEGFSGDLSLAHRLGEILGHQVSAVAKQIETVRREPTFEGFVESTAYQAKQHWRVKGPLDSTLKFTSALVDVPRRTYTEKELADMRSRITHAEKQVTVLQGSMDDWKRHQAGARARRFADLLKQWQQPVDPSPAQVEVQALRIGELVLVAMPGEPFAEIGQRVKKNSPFAFTMFCGYSDGVGGDCSKGCIPYMPIPEEYQHGGYEVEQSPYNPGAAQLVIDAIGKLLKKLQ